MFKFITIVCFAALVNAAINSGYNYQQAPPAVKQNYRPPPVSNNGIYPSQQAPPLPPFNVQSPPLPIKQNYIAPAPAVQPDLSGPPQQYQQQQLSAPPQVYIPPSAQLAVPIPQYAAPVQQPAAYAPNFGAGHSAQPQYNNNQRQQQQTIVSKDIYIHSAPEETEEIGSEQGPEGAGPIRKNYRIVFIKAPSQNIRFNINSLKRSQAANEEKTVIYVLSKKPDVSNFQNQLSAAQTDQKASKPEVYFIKYKTQEEANRAQQEIQAQYDALGGSTRISDEGIAPVTSVIGGGSINGGSAGASFGGGSSNFAGSNFAQSASNNQQQFVQPPASNNQQQFIAQQSFHGNQGAASNVNLNIETPNTKYLPVKKK